MPGETVGIRCLVAQQPYVNVLCCDILAKFLPKAILAGFCEVLNIFVTTSNGGKLLLYKTLNIEELAILRMPSILEGLNVLVVLSPLVMVLEASHGSPNISLGHRVSTIGVTAFIDVIHTL